MDYLVEHGSAATPQGEPLTEAQVENSAGGFVWEVDDWTRLRRFLILGTEGGSYYASERNLTRENVFVVKRLAVADGTRLVDEVVAISEAGRAPSNDPALYALAVALTVGDRSTRRAAAAALPRVARIGTHLFHFVKYLDSMRGWGKTAKWAIANWYASKTPDGLAYDVVKYGQRDGVSHRDVLRLAHPAPASDEHRTVFGFISGNKGHLTVRDAENRVIRAVDSWDSAEASGMIEGALKARRAANPAETAALIREYRLPWEAVNSDHRMSVDVWRALLDGGMPTGALVRNLATMTRLDVLTGDYRKAVVAALTDEDLIRKSRIHPLALLLALTTYARGRGDKGTNVWTPIPAIVDAVNDAFYLAFGNVEKTGKRILQALDISGSMGSATIAGTSLSAREASAALALVTVSVEDDVDTVTFSNQGVPGGYYPPGRGRFGGMPDGIEPFALSRRQRLDDVVDRVSRLRMGGTDCALPMLWAGATGRDYDAIVIYTDSETWAGRVHPVETLRDYRRATGHATRLIVVGMVSNGFSIADPNDSGMLDVVGFDSATPSVISEFIAGRV